MNKELMTVGAIFRNIRWYTINIVHWHTSQIITFADENSSVTAFDSFILFIAKAVFIYYFSFI